MTPKIKVFLVDDQELVRAGFAMLVGSQPDLEVVGQAGNGAEAVERLAATAADVVIMDVRDAATRRGAGDQDHHRASRRTGVGAAASVGRDQRLRHARASRRAQKLSC